MSETNSADAGLVSCVIPVFNSEPFVGEAINSVLAQTYQPIEIIVVDDGSTDGTADAVLRFGDQVLCVKQTNAGPVAARNHGARIARGEFISFLDADDLWDATKIERQIGRFQSRPDLGYSVTHCRNFWVPELAHEAERYRDHRISLPIPGYVTGTLVARRNAFAAVGPFDIKLKHGDSTDWFLRAGERGVAGDLLPDVLMYRRLHPGNRSRVLADASREQYLHLLKGKLDRRRNLSPAIPELPGLS